MTIRCAVWSPRRAQEPGTLSLTSRDADHQVRVYRDRNVEPESLDVVRAEFILQRDPLARHIIKELDILLKVGGEFVVVLVDNKAHASFMRSRDQVKNEFALATDGRYQLTSAKRSNDDKILTLRYAKLFATLPPNDSVDAWTFGIITDGRKVAEVHRLVRSIVRQSIPHCEILVCGPYEFEEAETAAVRRVLPDVKVPGDVRAPITHKKNRLIEAASHNNLCILHDRFALPDDWHARFRAYGNYYDILCLRTQDLRGNRFEVDWMTFGFPFGETVRRDSPLAYNEWSPHAIVQGGVIVAKKHVIDRYRLNEKLHWEELEDMQFSKEAFLNGAMINVDSGNAFISDAVNHQAALSSGPVYRLKQRILWLRGILASFVKFYLYQRGYWRSRPG